MRKILRMLAVFLFAASSPGCNNGQGAASSVNLAGTYGVQTAAGIQPVLRVSQDAAGVHLSEYNRGQWVLHHTLAHTVSQQEFDKLFGPGTGIAFTGVGSPDGGVVLQVPRGWHQGRFTTQTGYIVVLAIGAREAVKLD